MTRHALLWSIISLLALATIPACGQVNQEMIDRVAAGEIEEAKASWWGFDEEDSTEALQAAIDSGAPKLIVDNVGKPWIVRPIMLASDQEITFEEGVEVVAKRGEFKGRNDSLFSAINKENITLSGYGATLRMHRSDYDDPEQYERAEWRMVLNIRSSSNIKVYGLTLAESGGDGIYLGTATRGVTNKDIHIKDVICESNYRQGISVITAENLLIENTIMRNTDGTPPRAGIDFEPNHPEERLVNVVMRDCLTENNAGWGYVLYLRPMAAHSEPVSVLFENCRSVGDAGGGFAAITGNTADKAVTGSIEFVNCTVENSGGAGLAVGDVPIIGCEVRFVDCTVINPAAERAGMTPIQISSRAGADEIIGGIAFDRVRIEDALDRNPISYIDGAGGLPIEQITGTLILVRDGEERRVELSEEVLAEWMPVIAMKRIPRLGLEGVTLRPRADEMPAEGFNFGHGVVRRVGRFVIWASEGEEVRFGVHHWQVGRYAGRAVPVIITGPSGEEVHREEAPFEEEVEVVFTAPETGLYRVSADPAQNRLAVTQSSHPVNLVGEGRRVELIFGAGDYWFWVPAGTTEFGVRVAGEGTGEAIRAALIDPAGNVFEDVDNLVQTHQFEVELARPSEGEAWVVRLSRPSAQAWEDHSIDLRGVPPLLAPSAEALLVPLP